MSILDNLFDQIPLKGTERIICGIFVHLSAVWLSVLRMQSQTFYRVYKALRQQYHRVENSHHHQWHQHPEIKIVRQDKHGQQEVSNTKD